MCFHDDIHAKVLCCLAERFRQAVINSRQDNENGISAMGACFGNLDLVDHEFLAQDREGHSSPDRFQVRKGAAKTRIVCKDREAGCAAVFILAGNLDRICFRADFSS